MAGNSQRKGSIRKSSKGATTGSGGKVRRGLEGRGPTPKAKDRPNHKVYKSRQQSDRAQQTRPKRRNTTDAEWDDSESKWFLVETPRIPLPHPAQLGVGVFNPVEELGGVGALDGDLADATKAPLAVIEVPDLEGALAAVETAGGKVVRPIFAFPGGRRFHFVDPSGNELAAVKPD